MQLPSTFAITEIVLLLHLSIRLSLELGEFLFWIPVSGVRFLLHVDRGSSVSNQLVSFPTCSVIHSLIPGGSAVKNLPAMQGTWVGSLDGEDPLEKEMTTHSSILAWEIPWTEEPGRLYSPWGLKESDRTWQLNTKQQNKKNSWCYDSPTGALLDLPKVHLLSSSILPIVNPDLPAYSRTLTSRVFYVNKCYRYSNY